MLPFPCHTVLTYMIIYLRTERGDTNCAAEAVAISGEYERTENPAGTCSRHDIAQLLDVVDKLLLWHEGVREGGGG